MPAAERRGAFFSRWPGRLDPVFALILAAGAFLRLYDLGTQSQWIDEILSTLNASLSWHYIFSLSWNVEVHPPGYYLFKHIQLFFGHSDFWLRLPSALAGIACLPLAHRLALTLRDDRRLGHLAMALLAVSPLHIWASRQTRPYGIIALAAMALTLHLARAARGQTALTRPGALLWNFLFASLHFSGILFWGAQLVSLALLKIRNLVRAGGRDLCRYGLAGLLSIAPTAVFFLHARFVRVDKWISNKPSMAQAAAKLGPVLKESLFLGYQGVDALWMAQEALLLAGLFLAIRRGGPAGRLLAALTASVLGLLVLGGYAAHLTAVHLSFLLPATTTLAAFGAFEALTALRLRRFALVVPTLLLWAFYTMDGRVFYAPDASPAGLYGPADRFKDTARYLRNLPRAGMVPAFDDQTAAAAVLWYEAGFNDGTRVQRGLTAGDRDVVLCFFAGPARWKHADGRMVDKETGLSLPYLFQGRVGSLDMAMRTFARDTRLALGPGKASLTITAAPADFLVKSLDLKDVSLVLNPGDADDDPGDEAFFLSPTFPHAPGACGFRLYCDRGATRGMLALSARVSLLREGNAAALACRVNGGPWRVLDQATASDTRRLAGSVPLPAGKSVVEVRILLVFGGYSAFSMYGPNTQVRLHAFTASLAAP